MMDRLAASYLDRAGGPLAAGYLAALDLIRDGIPADTAARMAADLLHDAFDPNGITADDLAAEMQPA